MQVTIKLFASLAERLPPGSVRNQGSVEIDSDTPLQALIDRFGIADKDAHLVLVNGVFVAPEHRPTHGLKEGDAIAIWPPVAGG